MRNFIMALTMMILIGLVAGCTAPDESAAVGREDGTNSTDEPALQPVEEEQSLPEGTTESGGAGDGSDVVAPSGSINLEDVEPAPAAAAEEGELVVLPGPGVPDPAPKLAQIASQDLADRLSIDIGEVTLVASEAVEWPDSGLGCPSPDALYLTVITPGYRITLEAEGQTYVYHTDRLENVVLCVDGRPAE